jgi:hypothetical protein
MLLIAKLTGLSLPFTSQTNQENEKTPTNEKKPIQPTLLQKQQAGEPKLNLTTPAESPAESQKKENEEKQSEDEKSKTDDIIVPKQSSNSSPLYKRNVPGNKGKRPPMPVPTQPNVTFLEKQRTTIVSSMNISAAESLFEYANINPPENCSSAEYY